MPAGNDLSFVGNLLALPLTLQAMHQQWEQQRQSQAGQLPTAASAPQMGPPTMPPTPGTVFAPRGQPLGPEPPNPTGALNTPVLGTALRGIGTVGQILQVIGAPPPAAPRPMTMSEQIGVQKWQRQTQTGTRMSEAIGRGASREELAQIEAEGGFPAAAARFATQTPAGSTSIPGMLYQQGLEMAAEKGLSAGEAASFARAWAIDQTREQKSVASDKSPGFEKDLEAEATRRGLTGQARFEFKEQERARQAGIKTTATATAGADVKDKYAHLPAAAQNSLATIDTMRGVVGQVKELLNDPAVRGSRGVFEGRLRQHLYQIGMASEPNEDAYIALSNFVQIMGVQPFMRGTRNFMFIQQIQQHLPKPGDEPQLVERKLEQMDKYLAAMDDNIRRSARERLNPTTPAGPGAPPPDDAAAPAGGKTMTLPSGKVVHVED